MSVLGRLKSLFGFNEEDTSEISSFQDAGMTPDGTMGTATVDVIDQNQTLPDDVVKNPPAPNPLPTPQPQPNIPAPPPATPGINPYMDVQFNQMVTSVDDKGKKSQALQDIITLGGSQFDDDVYARKLRRQASMPDLKNEDYYPNEPFSESRTAWGDPIFSGAGAQFPMAAYDAIRKARAQAELDEASQQAMQIKIPEIKTGAYAERFKTGFIDEVSTLTNDYVKKYGNSKKAIQAMRQDGSLGKLQAKFEGLAKSIDSTAEEATNFLKNAQEKAGTLYFAPEGVKAANDFLTGMNAFADGLITPEQLNGLRERFKTAEQWETYKDRNLEKYSDDEIVPGLMGDTLTPEEESAYAKQLQLPNGFKDKRHFLLITKYSKANKDKIKRGIVEPFFTTNSTAFEQLKRGNETIDQTIDRVTDDIVAMRGDKIWQDVRSESEEKGTNININTGGTTTEQPYYERINAKRDEIVNNTKQALDKINKANQQGQQKVGALKGAVKNIFRGISDQGEVTKDYIGFEPVNVKPYNFKVQPTLLGEYMIFDEKTKSFRNSTPTDFPGLNSDEFGTTATGGSLSGQEIVLMTPDGRLVPWDSKDIPTGSELFVKQKITIDYVPKGINPSTSATMPAKSATVYSIGPITQNFKVSDETFQKLNKEESTQGAGEPFQFGQPIK